MSLVTLAALRGADPRLDRRLRSGPWGASDICALLRSGLVASGYATVDLVGSELERLNPAVLEAHGLCKQRLGWKAEPWLPHWLDHVGIGVDEPSARRASRQANWSVRGDDFYRDSSGFEF